MLNPMLKLDHTANDAEKALEEAPRIAKLKELRERFKDDYAVNSLARKKFREEKKVLEKTGVLFGDSDSKVKLQELSEFDEVRTDDHLESGQDDQVRHRRGAAQEARAERNPKV